MKIVDSPENQTSQSKRILSPRVRQVDGVKKATPLLLCLICIELSDFVFAVDSIPAVLGISHDTFIVYASNVSFTIILVFCCSAAGGEGGVTMHKKGYTSTFFCRNRVPGGVSFHGSRKILSPKRHDNVRVIGTIYI